MDHVVLKAAYLDHVAHLGGEYARVIEDAGLDALVLHSGRAHLRSAADDQYWPLRVTPHFAHWLPLVAPDCALVIRPGIRPKLIWLKEDNFWEQPAAARGAHWQGSFEIVEVSTLEAVRAHLPATSPRAALLTEDPPVAAAWGFARGAAEPPLKALDRLRVRKTGYERLCLAEANRVAALGHAAVRQAFFDGDLSELALHLLYLGVTAQDDPETPYKNIVALGEHAATLHHVSYDKAARARAADSLLLDAGATSFGYASDVTRTYVKGQGSTRSLFAELISRTEAMQQRLCGEAVGGLPYERLHERAHEEVGAILSDLGIVRVSAEEAVARGVTRAFFPHGLGHSLGLQCHDVGCAEVKPKPENPFLRNTMTIEDAQVFTVEPGIYFIDMLLGPLRHGPDASTVDFQVVDALGPLGGVRIEDDVTIEAGRAINLTRAVLPT
jgi:Xaa-Pro dipeptidase